MTSPLSHDIPQCRPLDLEEAKEELGKHKDCPRFCKAKDYLSDLVERLESVASTSKLMGWDKPGPATLLRSRGETSWNIW